MLSVDFEGGSQVRNWPFSACLDRLNPQLIVDEIKQREPASLECQLTYKSTDDADDSSRGSGLNHIRASLR